MPFRKCWNAAVAPEPYIGTRRTANQFARPLQLYRGSSRRFLARLKSTTTRRNCAGCAVIVIAPAGWIERYRKIYVGRTFLLNCNASKRKYVEPSPKQKLIIKDVDEKRKKFARTNDVSVGIIRIINTDYSWIYYIFTLTVMKIFGHRYRFDLYLLYFDYIYTVDLKNTLCCYKV